MAKFELSLAKNYVADWNYVDAVREIFQNALDQQHLSEDNDMFIDYDKEEEVLRIGNKTSVLDKRSLLLGATTKDDDDGLIGQFGEGYKIATLVLTREEHKVVFYNYGAKEIWRPRFVRSTRYGGEDILTFFTEKKSIWNKVPNNHLVVEINNITGEQYEKIKESNLHLQDVGDVYETKQGRILREDRYKGQVYVNGLFVCDYKDYEFGYDFKPKYLELDRDRKLVSDFSLRWLSSGMWNQVKDDSLRGVILDLIAEGSADVEFITSNGFGGAMGSENMANEAYLQFREEHGTRAVPVSNNEELELVKREYKAVMVNDTHKNLIAYSEEYKDNSEDVYMESKYEQLMAWLEGCRDKLSEEDIESFETIVRDI